MAQKGGWRHIAIPVCAAFSIFETTGLTARQCMGLPAGCTKRDVISAGYWHGCFSNAEGLTTTEGNAPAGFIIAGEDKRFFLADAELDGETIILTNANVKKPVAVRYAWADYPVVNLVNGEGLPAVPFRTDNWTASSVTAGQ